LTADGESGKPAGEDAAGSEVHDGDVLPVNVGADGDSLVLG